MSILRPQKILFGNLRRIDDLLNEIREGKELENISIEDIKGASINQFQAVDLLYLLGVKIKE